MNILILVGSPNKQGSTNILVREFARGAKEAGRVLGYGCGSTGMTNRSRYPQEAYELGKGL